MFSACRLSLSTLLFACLYWPALNSSATPLPEYTILRSAGPIAIDGLLDEPSWQYSQPVHPLSIPFTAALLARRAVENGAQRIEFKIEIYIHCPRVGREEYFDAIIARNRAVPFGEGS